MLKDDEIFCDEKSSLAYFRLGATTAVSTFFAPEVVQSKTWSWARTLL
jgi:hypothetical protein